MCFEHFFTLGSPLGLKAYKLKSQYLWSDKVKLHSQIVDIEYWIESKNYNADKL